MKGIAFIFFSILTSCYGFLLNNNVSSAFITDDEYRKLVDFILEEKQLRHAVEHNVGTLNQQLNRNKATHQALESNYQSLLNGHNRMNTTNDDLENKLSMMENENKTIYTTLGKNRADIADLKRITGAKSAFTAWNPTSAPRSGYIKFSSIQSNIGNDFNTSSGHFTCRYPGVYVFYLHLYRASTTSYSGCYCYIRKNGSNFVEAYNDPYSSYRNGYHETSNSITFRLRRGDTVSVGGCSTINDKYTYTSFTGFLVKAE